MADPVTIGAAVGWGMKAAGWVVSPIISKLVSKGFSYVGFDASEKLKQLEIKVLQLELALGLEIAEVHPHMNRLEPLLNNLKSSFYEAEDILDDVEYHRLERQIQSHRFRRNWVCKIQSALPKCSCLKNQEGGNMPSEATTNISRKELEKCLANIENIVNEAHKILPLLNLPSHSNADKRETFGANSRHAVTTSAPPTVVIGRDTDRDKIIDMLYQKTGDSLTYSVIGIHGIPGSGKSTLAQHVCTHEKKERHFDLIMWVHVSQNFSVDTIFSEMLEEATGYPCPEFKSRNTLQQKLEEALIGKRFLLVLDDVWYKKGVSEHELQKIVSPLKAGYPGSKILATSRTDNALLALGAVRCIPIADMDDDVFLRLFMHYALEGAVIDERDRPVLEEIGSGIAKKLSRSPLAVSTVGGQLRMRPRVDFWREVCNQDFLNETMGALLWSYRHLDEQVRRCFAYCSVFPRRYRLKRYELINMWVAEGFIKTDDAGEDMEDVGGRYFDELVSTSFLQPAGQRTEIIGTVDCFTVHDLLHDLAERVAGSDCFRIEDGWTGVVPRNVRHLFVEDYNKMMITEKILEMENLRTLIIPGDKWDTPIEEKEFEIMFMRLRKLRVLNVQTFTTYMVSFPESIGRLKHLRYLAFRTGYTSIQVLPSTFTKLYHMQILDFGRCRNVVFSSGEDMSNLISLRHVITVASLNFPNIGRLRLLQTLPFLTVKKEVGYELQQLSHLNNLRGKLRIHGLKNVQSKEEALEAKLVDKERLTELTLAWDDGSCISSDDEEGVLEGFCPPMQLQKLEIRDYHGSSYPNWMVDKNKNGPKYLQELKLSRCTRLRPAPQLFEYFIHLCSFWLFYCSWDTLPDNLEHLTSLKELRISECPNIRTLPMLPQSLLYFRLSHCDHELTRSCETIGHPNWQKIQHIPEKEIDYNRVLTFDLQNYNIMEDDGPALHHNGRNGACDS